MRHTILYFHVVFSLYVREMPPYELLLNRLQRESSWCLELLYALQDSISMLAENG